MIRCDTAERFYGPLRRFFVQGFSLDTSCPVIDTVGDLRKVRIEAFPVATGDGERFPSRIALAAPWMALDREMTNQGIGRRLGLDQRSHHTTRGIGLPLLFSNSVGKGRAIASHLPGLISSSVRTRKRDTAASISVVP